VALSKTYAFLTKTSIVSGHQQIGRSVLWLFTFVTLNHSRVGAGFGSEHPAKKYNHTLIMFFLQPLFAMVSEYVFCTKFCLVYLSVVLKN